MVLAVIPSLVLIAVNPTLQIPLLTHLIFLKTVPATEELNIHYALKHTHAFPSHDGLSYADISNRGSRPRLRDPCV